MVNKIAARLAMAWSLLTAVFAVPLALFATGKFSRYGNTRALYTALGYLQGSSGVGVPGDSVATITTGITAGTTAVTSLACSGGTSKALPNGSTVTCVSTTGTNIETYTLSASAAASATSISVVSQTANKARASGDLVFLSSFTPYLALNTTAPGDNALGTEYGATGYARQAVAWSAPTVADPPVTANSGIITFGPFTAGTGATVSNASLMDASSGGTAANQYAYWTLTTSKTPGTNDSLQVAASALTMSMS